MEKRKRPKPKAEPEEMTMEAIALDMHAAIVKILRAKRGAPEPPTERAAENAMSGDEEPERPHEMRLRDIADDMREVIVRIMVAKGAIQAEDALASTDEAATVVRGAPREEQTSASPRAGRARRRRKVPPQR